MIPQTMVTTCIRGPYGTFSLARPCLTQPLCRPQQQLTDSPPAAVITSSERQKFRPAVAPSSPTTAQPSPDQTRAAATGKPTPLSHRTSNNHVHIPATSCSHNKHQAAIHGV